MSLIPAFHELFLDARLFGIDLNKEDTFRWIFSVFSVDFQWISVYFERIFTQTVHNTLEIY